MDSQITDRIRNKAHLYCASALGGVWSQISAADLIIEPLPHGLTNELFICSLADSCNASVKKAVLRLYGKTLTSDIPLQIKIFKLLASKNLGPQLYGTFPDGRLEEYLPSSTLTSDEIRDPKISCIIARKIALLQNVKVPNIESNRNWIITNCLEFFKYFEELNEEAFENLIAKIPAETQQVARKLATKVDVRSEIQFLNSVISNASKSPLVFSNNDLHQNNILLVKKSATKASLFDRIVLIDFDYGCENFRPFEIANHFAEWRFDYKVEEYPYMTSSEDRFPSGEQMRLFVSAYLNECKALENGVWVCGDDSSSLLATQDEVDKFLEEVEPFVMASDLLWSLWGIKMAIQCPEKPTYWHLGGGKMDFYLSFKERYIAKQEWLKTKQSRL